MRRWAVTRTLHQQDQDILPNRIPCWHNTDVHDRWFENRDVATVGIPGAFLQTKMSKDKDDIHIIDDRRIAELLAKIVPEIYQEYVHQRFG